MSKIQYKLFNKININQYEMTTTDYIDPMCGCEICKKGFKEKNIKNRREYIPNNDIDYDEILKKYKANIKSGKRLKRIIDNIKKLKKGSVRKYQVSGYYEYKKISKQLKIMNLRHELIVSDKIFCNKLSDVDLYIEPGYNIHTLSVFKNKKTNVIFIKVWK